MKRTDDRHGRRAILGLWLALILSSTVLLKGGAGKADDRTAVSKALFLQMAPVFQSPRCMNCHMTDFPRQGDDEHRHAFNVLRGPDDRGAPGLHCNTCHQAANQVASGVPGAPSWRLAPRAMAWEGLSAGDICKEILDPKKSGMTPAELVRHLNEDALVGWAWQPGTDRHGKARTLPPLTRDQLVALAVRWVAAGNACPD